MFRRRLASRRTESRILGLRFTRRWGPHRIVYHLGLPRSTVQAVLHRYRMPLLRNLDQATGVDGGQLTAASLRVRHTRGSGARRPQEARTHPRRWRASQAGPHHRQSRQPEAGTQDAAPRVCLPASRRRRPLPCGVLRDPRRRTQGDRRSVLDERPNLLRGARHHRQRVMLDNASCYSSKLFA